jgi:hypothetical protein
MKYLLFLFLLTVPCLAQERYVIPVDEGKYDPSFLAFRKKLIKAAKNRDLEVLLSLTDREFRGSLPTTSFRWITGTRFACRLIRLTMTGS